MYYVNVYINSALGQALFEIDPKINSVAIFTQFFLVEVNRIWWALWLNSNTSIKMFFFWLIRHHSLWIYLSVVVG